MCLCVLLFSEKDDGKVDVVCDAVLACLDQLYSTQSHLFFATITALVKKTTPQLEIVLTKIKQLQGLCVRTRAHVRVLPTLSGGLLYTTSSLYGSETFKGLALGIVSIVMVLSG